MEIAALSHRLVIRQARAIVISDFTFYHVISILHFFFILALDFSTRPSTPCPSRLVHLRHRTCHLAPPLAHPATLADICSQRSQATSTLSNPPALWYLEEMATMPPKTLLDLPVELFHMILHELYDEDYEAFKMIRLASQVCKQHSNPLMFRTVVLSDKAGTSINEQLNILLDRNVLCSCAKASSKVKYVKINPEQLLRLLGQSSFSDNVTRLIVAPKSFPSAERFEYSTVKALRDLPRLRSFEYELTLPPHVQSATDVCANDILRWAYVEEIPQGVLDCLKAKPSVRFAAHGIQWEYEGQSFLDTLGSLNVDSLNLEIALSWDNSGPTDVFLGPQMSSLQVTGLKTLHLVVSSGIDIFQDQAPMPVEMLNQGNYRTSALTELIVTGAFMQQTSIPWTTWIDPSSLQSLIIWVQDRNLGPRGLLTALTGHVPQLKCLHIEWFSAADHDVLEPFVLSINALEKLHTNGYHQSMESILRKHGESLRHLVTLFRRRRRNRPAIDFSMLLALCPNLECLRADIRPDSMQYRATVWVYMKPQFANVQKHVILSNIKPSAAINAVIKFPRLRNINLRVLLPRAFWNTRHPPVTLRLDEDLSIQTAKAIFLHIRTQNPEANLGTLAFEYVRGLDRAVMEHALVEVKWTWNPEQQGYAAHATASRRGLP
ncbi:hypothetical protein IQ07DRAFT_599100 [Pyrenochaeta sp. DS3sAY3a]|nr:hypothetical protein IQ07DRAFT_599100 [Pyrenochaeta sp. DS3sAY3a]